MIEHCVACTELRALLHSEGNRTQGAVLVHSAEIAELKAENGRLERLLNGTRDCHEIADCNCTEEGCKTCPAGKV